MTSIGIIGAGVAGLHLGIKLVQAGIDATIYTPLSAEQVSKSRLLNSVSHQYDTILREREMGIEHWNEDNCRVSHGHHHFLKTPDTPPLLFWGAFEGHGRAVDYRLYLPALMQDFEDHGGKIELRSISTADIDELYEQHDLLAVGVGKSNGGFADFFPRVDNLSIHEKPPRLLCCGLYRGIQDATPCGVTISISAGHGELIEIPMQSKEGAVTVLLLENIPGGDMEELVGLDYQEDPESFNRTILEKLEQHHTSTFNRVDLPNFGLTNSNDLLQGSFLPITRRGYARIADDKYAIAIGDLRVTMDPVTGQGANLASYGAVKLAEQIIQSTRNEFDEEFCQQHEKEIEYRVAGTVNFNNAILNPQPQLIKLLFAMSENRPIADDFTRRFAEPESIWWDILQSGEKTDSYINNMLDEAA